MDSSCADLSFSGSRDGESVGEGSGRPRWRGQASSRQGGGGDPGCWRQRRSSLRERSHGEPDAALRGGAARERCGLRPRVQHCSGARLKAVGLTCLALARRHRSAPDLKRPAALHRSGCRRSTPASPTPTRRSLISWSAKRIGRCAPGPVAHQQRCSLMVATAHAIRREQMTGLQLIPSEVRASHLLSCAQAPDFAQLLRN